MKRIFASFVLAGAMLMSAPVATFAQQTPTLAAPTIFRMSGTLQKPTGEPRSGVVVMVAAVYTDQGDVTSLWSEAQTLTIDATGRYSLLVGGTVEGGVPSELFRNGTGRWIGVGIQGEAEQPRVMMFAVPYAVKALDADMLGGKTAADFVLSNKTSVKNADGTTSPMVPTTDPLDITACCTHVITGSGNAAQVFDIKNTLTGTGASSRFRLWSDNNDSVVFASYSSGFTAAGLAQPSSALLNVNTSGGLSIAASHASGAIRLYTGGSASPRLSLSAGGVLSVTGTGFHTVAGNGNETHALDISNATTGTAASTRFRLFSDGNDQVVFSSYSSGFTAAGLAVPGSGLLNINSAGGLAMAASHTSGSLRFISGGTTERMRIDSAGNVGIGTTSPTSKLDVTGSINVTGGINAAGNVGIGTTSPAYKLDVLHGGATGARIASSSSFSVLDIDANNGDAALRFYKAGVSKWLFRNRPADDYLELFELGGGGSRFVVQRSTGNVGIGETTSPAYKLDVLHGGGLGVHVKSSASYSVLDIDAFNGDAALRFQKGGVVEWIVRNDPATDNLQFFESGSGERMRIDNATGKVWVNGAFTVLGVKAFTMDHPLDPENKLLMHAAAESNEVINFYSGNTTTDGSGLATVALPDYFEAINKDFRYQLTVIGTFAQAIVNKEVRNNTFEIATSQPNVKVSWEVKGVRNDARMKRFPFQAEEDKAPGMRGTFVDPEVYNVPRASGGSGKRGSSVDAQGRPVAVAPNPLNTSGGSTAPGPIKR